MNRRSNAAIAALVEDKRTLDVSDERNLGDGIFVTTAYGLAFDADEDECAASHVRSFGNVREARRALRWVEPCKCLRCSSLGKLA